MPIKSIRILHLPGVNQGQEIGGGCRFAGPYRQHVQVLRKFDRLRAFCFRKTDRRAQYRQGNIGAAASSVLESLMGCSSQRQSLVHPKIRPQSCYQCTGEGCTGTQSKFLATMVKLRRIECHRQRGELIGAVQRCDQCVQQRFLDPGF